MSHETDHAATPAEVVAPATPSIPDPEFRELQKGSYTFEGRIDQVAAALAALEKDQKIWGKQIQIHLWTL